MSQIKDITLTEDQLEGTAASFSKWLVSVGDRVEAGAPVAEIETDKVALEIVAPESGQVTELLVEEGDSMSAGTTIARLDADASAPVTEDHVAGVDMDSVLEDAISLDSDDYAEHEPEYR